MRHRLFNFAAAVSMVTCLGAAALWVRSCWITDGWTSLGPSNAIAVVSSNGEIVYWGDDSVSGQDYRFRHDPGYFSETHGTGTGPYANATSPRFAWATVGLKIDRRRWMGMHWLTEFDLPYWFLIMLTAVLPVIWIPRTLRARRREQGRMCVSCGYCLTGNTSGICPECGTPVADKVGAKA